MPVRAIGLGAMVALLAACGGNEGETQLTNNIAADAPSVSNAQAEVRALPEGQRNAVLIRAIRDAGLTCQHVEESMEAETSNNLPVFMATCEDGAVYAVAVGEDGTATVQPVTPAEGR